MSWVTVGVAAAGAIAGRAKNKQAQAQEQSDRQLAAETQRYSPWTGMQAQGIRKAGSEFGDMFSGGVQGAMMGQSISNGMAGMNQGPNPVQYNPNNAGTVMPAYQGPRRGF